MNFDEAGLNNRGEYEKKDLTVFTSKELLKELGGRAPVRSLALNDGTGNVTLIPYILGGGIMLAVGFIGAVAESQVMECLGMPGLVTDSEDDDADE
jgi:hypothetical protein